MKRLTYLGSLLILLASLSVSATDASPGEIRKLEVFPAGGEVRVEITLSAAVVPSVETAHDPERLVVKLPGTASHPQQKRIAVRQYGVRTVRFGLNQLNPPETRLIVDLDEEHPYKMTTEGTRIVLLIQPSVHAAAPQRNTPAGAASKPLFSSVGSGKWGDGTFSSQTNAPDTRLTPPAPSSPIQFPQGNSADSSSAATARASTEPPSARHPNRASLQEGTVFPSAGSPGTGQVPPVAGALQPSSLYTQNSAHAKVEQASAQPQSFPQEPTLSTNVAPEPAASVRLDAVASLPPAPGQNVAEQSDQNGAVAATPAAPVPTVAEPVPAPTAPQNAASVGKPEPAVAEPVPAQQANAEGSGTGRVPQLIQPQGENPDFRTAFRVKYVAQDAAYLDGGRSVGLAEGMKLVVRDLPNAGGVAAEGADSAAAGDVAELEVLSVAESSAVTEIHEPKRPVKVGDLAYLSSADQQALVEKNALSATRKYPAVVSFTENDTLDEEARAALPKPPSPAINRSRGRIGFDYIGVLDHGTSNLYTNNVGLVLRADITRIGGTYWNMSGYWRGRFDHTSAGPQTLQDLINRTYHLYTSYDNPHSSWVAGFGRMYLPWATSLDTLDGGYAGRKLKEGVTTGIFLGSTPDPTSFSYAPNRQIGGAFINFEGGSYEDLHYTSTTGGGMQMLSWAPDRPFVFFENGIYYKRIFSIYQAAQIDSHAAHTYQTSTGPFYQAGTNWGLGRSFTTIRFQLHPRVEFSVNHTYYRDLPFVDPSSITSAGIAAGLFDKFLSQGTMGGVRVEIRKQIWVNADLGMSNHSGESKNSLNQLFGISFGHLPWINAHADARYSRFSSSFGSGTYEALAVSRNLTEGLQLQVLAGQQNFSSTLTSANRSRFVNGMIESNLGQHYFVQVGGTISRGNQMNYDQWLFTFGYRFDNRQGQKAK
jgi:AMIN domain